MTGERTTPLLPEVSDWQQHMDCQRVDVDPMLFEDSCGAESFAVRIHREAAAKAICASCEVRLPCLTDALEQENMPPRALELKTELGIRGGLTREERTLLRKKQPGNPFGR